MHLKCDFEVHQCSSKSPAKQVVLPRTDTRLFEGIDPEKGTCPAVALAGIPLVVRRLHPPEGCTTRSHHVNKMATFFNIQVDNGFAPIAWQAWVGPALAYRADGGDLTEDDVFCLYDCVTRLADRFSEMGKVPKSRFPVELDCCIDQVRLNDFSKRQPLTLQTTAERRAAEQAKERSASE